MVIKLDIRGWVVSLVRGGFMPVSLGVWELFGGWDGLSPWLT